MWIIICAVAVFLLPKRPKPNWMSDEDWKYHQRGWYPGKARFAKWVFEDVPFNRDEGVDDLVLLQGVHMRTMREIGMLEKRIDELEHELDVLRDSRTARDILNYGSVTNRNYLLIQFKEDELKRIEQEITEKKKIVEWFESFDLVGLGEDERYWWLQEACMSETIAL